MPTPNFKLWLADIKEEKKKLYCVILLTTNKNKILDKTKNI